MHCEIIVKLHLALSFRTKQIGGGGGVPVTYLQLPENLRLAAGLEVLQSPGPEAVLLVEGAVAARRAGESTTTQEPQGESSAAASGPLPPPKATFFFFSQLGELRRKKSFRTLSRHMPSRQRLGLSLLKSSKLYKSHPKKS